MLVGQILHDYRSLGELLAVVQFQNRHLVFGVDAGKHRPVRSLSLDTIQLRELKFDARFTRHDMRRQRAGARPVIKLHG